MIKIRMFWISELLVLWCCCCRCCWHHKRAEVGLKANYSGGGRVECEQQQQHELTIGRRMLANASPYSVYIWSELASQLTSLSIVLTMVTRPGLTLEQVTIITQSTSTSTNGWPKNLDSSLPPSALTARGWQWRGGWWGAVVRCCGCPSVCVSHCHCSSVVVVVDKHSQLH